MQKVYPCIFPITCPVPLSCTLKILLHEASLYICLLQIMKVSFAIFCYFYIDGKVPTIVFILLNKNLDIKDSVTPGNSLQKWAASSLVTAITEIWGLTLIRDKESII